ncbi:MAG TPA: hypothetical protein ENF87_01860 [Thermoproteales archaeon]|nr:hypothetical protein [Thermoproteales archaeon]
MGSKINNVEVFYLKIPFKRPFKISTGTVGAPGKPGDHIYLKITTSDGLVGWGEVRPAPTWMYETPHSVVTTIKYYIASIVKGFEPYQIREILYRMDKALASTLTRGFPFAKSGVEVALFDLLGKLYGAPLHVLLGGKRKNYVEMSYLVSGPPSEVGEICKHAVEKGFKLMKLKLMGNMEEDYERVKSIFKTCGNVKVWLDANQAYRRHTLTLFLRKIRDYLEEITVFEQPVPAYDLESMKYAKKVSPIPIAADESVFTAQDLAKLLRIECVDVVVLKLAKSGIIENLKISSLAEAFGLDLYGSGMTESGLGLIASTHLFSVLDIVAPVDTNGPQFLKDLIVDGIQIEGCRIKVPDKPGLGVKVREEKIEEYRVEL